MPIPRDLALNPDNAAQNPYDLAIVAGDLTLVYDNAAIVSDVESVLLFMLGEWFADQSQGLPWMQAFQSKKPDIGSLRARVFTALGNVQGVTRVSFVTINVNSVKRTASVTWEVFADATRLGSTVVLSP